jgi:deferrochelatase/peroxidase EfeB
VAGSVAAGYATGASSRAARPAAAAASDPQAHLPTVPFHGPHQAGILPQPRRQTAVLSFTVTAEGRGELTDLFQTLTDRARFLTVGDTPPPVGITGPPSDSGVLGPVVVPDGLTVTRRCRRRAVRRPLRPGGPEARAPDHDGALP